MKTFSKDSIPSKIFGDDNLRRIVLSRMTGLRVLKPNCFVLSGKLLEEIEQFCPRLECLTLSKFGISCIRLPFLSYLKEVDLEADLVNNKAWELLEGMPTYFPNLETLKLRVVTVRSSDNAVLTSNCFRNGLKQLYITSSLSFIDPTPIFQSPAMKTLEAIEMEVASIKFSKQCSFETSRLKTLKIHVAHWEDGPNESFFLKCLAMCPRLENLSLVSRDTKQILGNELDEIRNLKSLELSYLSEDLFIRIFRRNNNLEKLSIQVRLDDNNLNPLESSMESKGILDAISSLEKLKELSIDNTHWSFVNNRGIGRLILRDFLLQNSIGEGKLRFKFIYSTIRFRRESDEISVFLPNLDQSVDCETPSSGSSASISNISSCRINCMHDLLNAKAFGSQSVPSIKKLCQKLKK
jgi:hypothetical protein